MRAKNTEMFIGEASRIHNGFYDYSKVNYINSHVKVEIICPIHGSFWKTSSDHISGERGCPRCGWSRIGDKMRFDKNRFVKDSVRVHGNFYNYDKVVYVGSNEKVCITCKKHGDFWQSPSNHVHRHGCPSCAGQKRHDKDFLISRAGVLYGDRFDCSNSVVKNRSSVIDVKCPLHGVIRLRMAAFLEGKTRCPECEKERKRKNFVERSVRVHHGRYDYSLVRYKNLDVNVDIICGKHGIFSQSITAHLDGCGCLRCYGDRLTLSTEEFIRRGREVHGSKYDYSKVKYERAQRRVVIVCKKHGTFSQTPSHHLLGQGCPKCSFSIGENNIAEILDSLGEKYEIQKRFEGCRDKKTLPFDFYLSGRAILIEADGSQHFRPFSFTRDKSEEFKNECFRALRRRDRIKDRFAENGGFKLVRIPHMILYNKKKIRRVLIKSFKDSQTPDFDYLGSRDAANL